MRLTISLAIACVLLTGCEQTINHWREGDETVATGKNYPIKVAPTVSAVSLQLTEHKGLSPESMQNLNLLLTNQGRLSKQQLTIQPYSNDGQQFANKLHAALQQAGAIDVRILPMTYQADKAQWDLRVQSQALVVTVPDCRIHDASTWTTKPYEAIGPLGCATRANLARMVSDPADLLRAKELGPADGEAALQAVKRYQEDELKELLDIDFNED
ncbi:CpaD family pilus assembly lipoprotein [Vibrio tritonius]|uniref:CpaD family pilus assembly lipoprotein n=1 Tax=Vibrio tritonius TaxID=1435069 RepID=UPI00315D5D06